MSDLKILLFDIETRYSVARVWRTGEQYVGHDQIIPGEHADIICIGYKWYGEKKVNCLTWDKNQNSARMIAEFTKIVESADLVVAHNGDRFDIKHINSMRLIHGQAPIAWPTSEDTLKQLKRVFALPSYKLDYVSKLLTGISKNPMSFSDWVEVVENRSAKHLKKMVVYCKRDVLLLEAVYKKIAAFLPAKVHASLVKNNSKVGCPRCGRLGMTKDGVRVTKTGRYQRMRCPGCATVAQSTTKLP